MKNNPKDFKKKLIDRVMKSGSLPIAIEIAAADIYLTDTEMKEILKKYYKVSLPEKFSTEAREAIATALSNQFSIGSLSKTGERIYNKREVHPFIDRNEGIVLADLETIIRAVYDLIDNKESKKFNEGIALLNKDLRSSFIQEKEIRAYTCLCGSSKNYRDCCKKMIEERSREILGRREEVENPLEFFKEFHLKFTKKKKEEEIMAEYIFGLHHLLIYIKKVSKFPRIRKDLINEIARESINHISEFTSSYEVCTLNVFKEYANLLTLAVDVETSNFLIKSKWNELSDDLMAILMKEQAGMEKTFSGLSTKTLRRIKVLELFEKSLSTSKEKDYSLISFGYISILEKELNDLRKLILPDVEKSLTLKSSFDFYKGIEDPEIIESILPLYYSFRFIREEKLDDVLRSLRNMIAHGELLNETTKEFETVWELCMGTFGILKAISICKLRVQDKVAFDKNKVLLQFVEKFNEKAV